MDLELEELTQDHGDKEEWGQDRNPNSWAETQGPEQRGQASEPYKEKDDPGSSKPSETSRNIKKSKWGYIV